LYVYSIKSENTTICITKNLALSEAPVLLLPVFVKSVSFVCVANVTNDTFSLFCSVYYVPLD